MLLHTPRTSPRASQLSGTVDKDDQSIGNTQCAAASFLVLLEQDALADLAPRQG